MPETIAEAYADRIVYLAVSAAGPMTARERRSIANEYRVKALRKFAKATGAK
jgi:hypothetical protein